MRASGANLAEPLIGFEPIFPEGAVVQRTGTTMQLLGGSEIKHLAKET